MTIGELDWILNKFIYKIIDLFLRSIKSLSCAVAVFFKLIL